MVRFENECVGCEGYYCIGSSCSLLHSPHYYCDRCGSEEDLYDVDGESLCKDCAKESIKELSAHKIGICEECEGEDELYEVDGRMLCLDCAVDSLKEIDYDEEARMAG